MAMTKEWLDFLRQQYPVGSRIKLREVKDGSGPLSPGDKGTLEEIDEDGCFHVKWSDGSILPLTIGEDRFIVQPPEPTMLKLYMPLTADLFEYNEYGDLEEDSIPLTDREIRSHEGLIMKALIDNRGPEEAERGIMNWYHEDDGVDEKVISVIFTLEERNGKVWGVAECQVLGKLTPEELETLKDFISGQASDGWGEGFEQKDIEIEDGVMNVHLWSGEDDWSIQTEEERFGPKLAEGLPELCFSTLPHTGELICIKRGESGYYPSDWSTSDPEQNQELADYNNEQMGVTPAQRHAMEIGSMVGWSVPGADPATWQEHFQKNGEMTLE